MLDSEPNVLRPANHPKGTPGRGFAVYEKNGEKLAVLCLQGRTFMPPLDCPFPDRRRNTCRLRGSVRIRRHPRRSHV